MDLGLEVLPTGRPSDAALHHPSGVTEIRRRGVRRVIESVSIEPLRTVGQHTRRTRSRKLASHCLGSDGTDSVPTLPRTETRELLEDRSTTTPRARIVHDCSHV